MQIYLVKNGAQTGPFTMEEVQKMVFTGQASPTDYGWHAGLSDWAPLSSILTTGKFIDLPPVIPVPSGLAQFGRQSDAEKTRNTYLTHEASLRSFGFLYCIPGVLLTLVAIATLVILIMPFGHKKSETPGENVIVFAVSGLLGWLFLWMGLAMRRLNPRVKSPATIFAVVGLLAFPIGTLINGYLLYLMHSAKGTVVFSPEYQDVIAETPHIKYKTSIAVWILVAIVLLIFALVGLDIYHSPRY